jgi:hypothetical protein
MDFTKGQYEYLRIQAKQNFTKVRQTWIDCGRWVIPHRIKWMTSQIQGERNNQHIVDSTHILSHRSFVAGFLEGNTSASRPWARVFSKNDDLNEQPENKSWLQKYTDRCHHALTSCNYYNAAAGFYSDFGGLNTGGHYIDEIRGNLYFHNMDPGSYFVINNGFNEATVLVREFALTVKALVDTYGRKVNGKWDWSNFSNRVRRMYEVGNYTQKIDVVHIVKENNAFDPNKPQALLNKRWIAVTYEIGSATGQYFQDGYDIGNPGVPAFGEQEMYLKRSASKRKPFIVGKSDAGGNFEYGEKGPTSDALGLIKSLNKKAIGKDEALQQMLRPALQGPANLRKSYITTASNSYVPLDPTSLAQKGLRPIFEVNPGIGALVQDVSDMREQVGKLYYSDYLLYLSQNPKTRTATETNAVVQEQQLIIGPCLQSLNWTYNVPLFEFVMDFVLDKDPYLEPPPQGLSGQFLQAEFISVFAQAQKAADLPSIDRYIAKIMEIGQIQPKVWDKVNIDKFCDLYEDRLFLPTGLNNPQGKVDAMREQAQAMAQRQQMMEQTIPAMAGAAKDVGMKAQQQQSQ